MATLKDEISKPDYAGITDEEIADALNVKTIPVVLDLIVAEVEKIIVPTGELFGISTRPVGQDPLSATCWNYSRMLDRWSIIPTSSPPILDATTASLDDLEKAGLLSAASVKSILDMTQGTVTYLSTIGATSPLSAADIANARAE